MWVVLVEATFKFRGVPEHLLGERQLTNHYAPWPLLFVFFVRFEESDWPDILVRGLRVYNSVDEFDREYPQFTHLLDDYVGWLLGELRSVNRGLEDLEEEQEDQ
jgi:hypothetical protein